MPVTTWRLSRIFRPRSARRRVRCSGVSAFQINFGSSEITTAGDAPDVLVAMNPAALKTNVQALKPGGLIIADTGEFNKRNMG